MTSCSKMATTPDLHFSGSESDKQPPGFRQVRQASAWAVTRRVFREMVGSPERLRLAVAITALVLSSANNLAFPTVMGKAVDYALRPELNETNTRKLGICILSIFGLGALASWVRVFSFGAVAHKVELRMRKKLFSKLLHQEMEFFSTHKVGDMTVRLLRDAEVAAGGVSHNIGSALRGLNSALGGTVILLLLSRRLTLMSLSLVPLIGIGAVCYTRYVRRLTKSLQDRLGDAIGSAGERLSAMRTVRLFGQEATESRRFSDVLDRLTGAASGVASADGIFMGALSFAINASLLGVLFLGGSLVHKGQLTVGSLTSFALYSSMVGLGFSSLSKVYGDMVKASTSASRIFEILDRPELPLDEGLIIAERVRGEVRIEGVKFHYTSRPNHNVLDDFSLTIPPGQVVGVAGSSGAGKTTLVSLLCRLYPPSAGRILIDGQDIQGLNPTWMRRRVIGIVTQEPVLFAGTVADNVRYGLREATKEQVEAALRDANAWEFVQALPNGMDTEVGEKATLLSTGQKQRVAIARAIIKNPPVLILDEATSALDGESERAVQEALERAMQGRTVLMIAHRSSTLEYAQRVVVLEAGQIVQSGTYSELMAAPGPLQTLMRGLKSDESLDRLSKNENEMPSS